MIKNKLKLSLATSLLLGAYGYAGTLTAPNINNIELSGDIELKAVSEKTDTATINKRTAEINLNLDAKAKNGLEIYSTFTAYDNNQADAEADKSLRVKHAYAVIPLMEGKGKVVAGLAPNFTYGTDAFEDGGEDWKAMVQMPIVKDVKIAIISKIKNEEEQDANKGDIGATEIRVDAKVGDFMVGAKYTNGYKNKDDGLTGDQDTTELESKVFMAYGIGEVSGLNVGFEYAKKDMEKVGANNLQQFKDAQVGYFAKVEKEVGNFTTGLSYLNLSKGMKGGDDFAVGMILDGNIESSATEGTTAFITPVSYKINKNLTANATYVSADIQGKDAREFDLGLEYGFNDNVTLSATYGDFDGAMGCVINDTKNFEIALAITF